MEERANAIWLAKCRELVETAGELLRLDQATCEEIISRAFVWRHLPGESMYALLAFATYDTLCDLSIGEESIQIARAFDVPLKQLLRIERKLLRLRPRQAAAFLPLITRRWNLPYRDHCTIRQMLQTHDDKLQTLQHAPKSIACAAAYLHLKNNGRLDGRTYALCCQLAGLHACTFRQTLMDIRSLLFPLQGQKARADQRTTLRNTEQQASGMPEDMPLFDDMPPAKKKVTKTNARYGRPDEEALKALLKCPSLQGDSKRNNISNRSAGPRPISPTAIIASVVERQINHTRFSREQVPEEWKVKTYDCDRVFIVNKEGVPIHRHLLRDLVKPWVEPLAGIKLTSLRTAASVTRLELAGVGPILNLALTRLDKKESQDGVRF